MKSFIKITIKYIYLLWLIFSTTHTGKGHESQILLPGGMDPNFVPYNIWRCMYRIFKTCNGEGENIIWTLFECIYVDMIVVI